MNRRILLLILTLVLPASQAYASYASVWSYKLGEYLGIASYQASVGQWEPHFNDAIRAAQSFMSFLSTLNVISDHDIMFEVQSAQSSGYHPHHAIATLRHLYQYELKGYQFHAYRIGLNIGIARGHASGGSDWGEPNLKNVLSYVDSVWGTRELPSGESVALTRCHEPWGIVRRELVYARNLPMDHAAVVRASRALVPYIDCAY